MIFKLFIEFVTILSLFYVSLSWPCGMWALISQPGIKPVPPAMKGEVLTTGLLGKSPTFLMI